MLRVFLFVSSLILLTSSCKEGGTSTSVIQDKQVYTVQDQSIIGNELSASMKTDAVTYDILNANAYPEVSTYLNTMLNSAVISEHVLSRADFEWEIITMVDEEPYAYTMPGGKVVISTGILKALQNESELLALLANEIYFTDIDLHTEALRDEYSGIRIGNVALGNSDEDPAELVSFLKYQSFSEEQMIAADQRTVAVMCPFNYDVTSLMSLVERSFDMGAWQAQRARPENWQEILFAEFESCENTSDERFRSRYMEMIATLP